jgi:two-component system, chemotaxis family, CheB/CheR fusion protein
MTDGNDGAPTSEVTPERRRTRCPAVGIGASAGGVEALQKFLPAVTPDSGLAYVVIMHLDPRRESALTQVLSRIARVPVVTITHKMPVEPNRVHVVPPNAMVSIDSGEFLLAKAGESRGRPTIIDGFLISLAEDLGENAACVILSGTGSDGTVGLRAIKEHGGLTLAQAQAEYEGMMRSAVSTGLVDFLLPVVEMPAKLAEHFRHLDGILAR